MVTSVKEDNSTAIMDITLISEVGDIMKVYFVTYNTPVIDLILEYITYIHTYIHTSIHTYTHTHTHTYIHTYINTYNTISKLCHQSQRLRSVTHIGKSSSCIS